MNTQPSQFNEALKTFIQANQQEGIFITNVFLEMHAVGLMLNYLYKVERKKKIPKRSIYEGFFKASFVAAYCDQNGIETATQSGAEHRCPFLLNILESLGIIRQRTKFNRVVTIYFIKGNNASKSKDTDKEVFDRITKIETQKINFQNQKHRY